MLCPATQKEHKIKQCPKESRGHSCDHPAAASVLQPAQNMRHSCLTGCNKTQKRPASKYSQNSVHNMPIQAECAVFYKCHGLRNREQKSRNQLCRHRQLLCYMGPTGHQPVEELPHRKGEHNVCATTRHWDGSHVLASRRHASPDTCRQHAGSLWQQLEQGAQQKELQQATSTEAHACPCSCWWSEDALESCWVPQQPVLHVLQKCLAQRDDWVRDQRDPEPQRP